MTSLNKNGDLSGGTLIFSSVATNGSCSQFFTFCPPGRTQRTTAVRYGYKISQRIPIHVFHFSEITEAVCEEPDRHNVLTESFHSAILEGYIEQQQSGQTVFLYWIEMKLLCWFRYSNEPECFIKVDQPMYRAKREDMARTLLLRTVVSKLLR